MKHSEDWAGLRSMNTGWRFSLRDYSVLPVERTHGDVYNYAKAGGAGGPAGNVFDDSDWEEVCLPHDWVTAEEFDRDAMMNHGYKNRGTGWYRLKFLLDEEAREKQLLIEFEGMSAEATVYVNGQMLYKSNSGYQGFCVDMTDVANFGTVPNIIAIRIDAAAWEGWWYEGAGIYRCAWMIQKARVHTAHHGIFAEPVRLTADEWKIQIHHTLESSFEEGKAVEIKYTILTGDRQCVACGNDKCFIDAYDRADRQTDILIRNPLIWSLQSPDLYCLRTEIWYDGSVQDYCENTFGCRTVSFDSEKGFFLNGENIKIKGFCNHQDHAGTGVAVPYAVKEYRVRQLLKTGANAYRCAHNTDPEILDICDRLGMVVMEENRTFSTAPHAMEALREMVREARNHPCVILYSIMNEEPWQGTEKGRRMAARMRACVKREDTGRPVLGALNGGYMEDGVRRGIDIMGMNYNARQYDEFHERFPQMPLIASETVSAYSVRGEYGTDWGRHIIDNYDEHHAPWGNTAREAWQMVLDRPFVAGTFVWTGFDYRGEPTPFSWPSVSAFFGVFDSCGFPKDAFWLYQAFWKKDAVIHILPDWTLEYERGTPVRVVVFTNCEEVELSLNGRPAGARQRVHGWTADFEVPYEPGTLEAKGYREGRAVASDRRETCGAAVCLKLECDRESLRDDGLDAAVINAYACDDKGRVVYDAGCPVEFRTTEGAYIAGIGNGNPNSQEPDTADRRRLFHGCAQAVLRGRRSETDRKTVKIRATAPGLSPGCLELSLEKAKQIPHVRLTREQIVGNWRMCANLSEDFPGTEEVMDYDQNSFEPVSFCGKPQPQFMNQYLKYALYRTELTQEETDAQRYLVFPKINGQVWIRLNGECILSRTDVYKGEMRIELPRGMRGRTVLTVVIRNMDWKWFAAGIIEPVYIRTGED